MSTGSPSPTARGEMRRFPLVLVLMVLAGAVAAQTAPSAADSAAVELPPPPVAAQAAPEEAAAATPTAEATAILPSLVAAPAFNATADSLTVLVDYRSETEIQRDLQAAVSQKALAERRTERARMLEKLAASRIEIKISEMKALEAEISFAKSEKNEGRRKELEGRRRFAESEKQLLERRRDLRTREIETARAVREYHEATEKSCRLELDLAVNRRERAAITSTVDPAAAAEFRRLQAEITKLEGRVLQAQVEQAGKWKDLAEQEVRLGKVRRAVYDSQLKVAEGSR